MTDDRSVRVCVPVCAKTFAEMEEACVRANAVGDIVEVRLDCLENLNFYIAAFVNKLSHPVILTLRPAEQGGYKNLTRLERKAFWTRDLKPDLLLDIEADLVLTSSFDWPRVIVSHHDFNGVPDDLDEIYDRLAATPARIVKIAVQANDITDCIHVFRLLERSQKENRELIAIAMGDAGIATRILGPSRGAYLTYGSLEDKSATAPGQVNAQQMRSVYRIDQIDRETMICGLVGRPVMHSVSPHMHNAAFAAEGVNGVYLPLEVRDVESFVRRMIHPATRELDWNVRGLSITAPHKASMMPLLNYIDPVAEEVGAVNTVVIENHGLHGYNTDVLGFISPLRERLGSLKDSRVAVIGAGGAARAAVWALSRDGAKVTLFARNMIKGGLFAERFNVTCEPLANASFRGYDVVVNATPQSPATAEQLAGARLVYDLIYNPIETEFLNQGRYAGCQTLGGLPMLVAQARLQFELWTGKTPPASVMHGAATAALGRWF